MPYATVSLTSASTNTSAAVALSWMSGKPTTVSVTGTSSTQTSDFTIQYTLDDVMQVGGSSLARWSGVSSAIGAVATHFTSSSAYPDGHFYQFVTPVAAVRLGSTAISSGSLSLKALQGEVG